MMEMMEVMFEVMLVHTLTYTKYFVLNTIHTFVVRK